MTGVEESAPDLSGVGRIWLVGCGKLGRALAAGWLRGGLPPGSLVAIDPVQPSMPEGVHYAPAPGPALPVPDVVVLAVKPQTLPEAATALAPQVRGLPLISVLAGAPLATLAARLPGARIVRALPNTAARIGRSATLLAAAADAEPADRARAEALMAAVGRCWWVVEAHLDAASAVSASGPAFLFRYIEALAAAGRVAGLPDALAEDLALETVAGAGLLALTDPRPPAALREEVTSPNGMTQAGLEVLDGAGSLSTLLRDTIRAAARRSAELGRDAA